MQIIQQLALHSLNSSLLLTYIYDTIINTMNAEQLRYLITHTLAVMDKNLSPNKPKYNTPQAVDLLFGTACVESDCGYYIKQLDAKNPALGFFQMEKNTHNDIWNNHINYNKDLEQWMLGEIPPNQIAAKFWMLEHNIRYAIIMCRLHYYRVAEPITIYNEAYINKLGDYWKKHYNTINGKGSVADFVLKFYKYDKEN